MPVISHHFLVQLLFVLPFVFVDDVVQDLRRHVLRRCHGKLRNVSELEGRAVVDELYVPYFAVFSLFVHF